MNQSILYFYKNIISKGICITKKQRDFERFSKKSTFVVLQMRIYASNKALTNGDLG